MSLSGDFTKNLSRAALLRELDTTESRLMYCLLYLFVFLCVKICATMLFRALNTSFLITAATNTLTSFLYCLIFSFFVKFLDHKSNTPYAHIMTIVVFAKLYAPLFIVIGRVIGCSWLFTVLPYSIINVIYMYNNLVTGNQNTGWFWLIMLVTFLTAGSDIKNLEIPEKYVK